ncbi:MAG: hypothetical protein ACRELD_14845 [Longimicrobiales bacterium]
MGGKRPDQHNIDPAEAGATDYKFRPNSRTAEQPQDEEVHGRILQGPAKKRQKPAAKHPEEPPEE